MTQDRHLFPGGNTPLGFFSYYPYILPQDSADHIFCIKGGPGVGKSTFMKKVGEAMGERGHPVEYMHCSSDPDSLDGLVIPGLRVALIDGTAPHVVDPKNPGAVDEIVNLGECWNLAGIKEHKQDVISTTAAIGRLFGRVYRLLAASCKLHDDLDDIHNRCADEAGAEVEYERLLPLFEGCRRHKALGRERKLFASAITPNGLIHYLGSIAPCYGRLFALKGYGRIPGRLLSSVRDEAIRRGLDVESFYCPMDPSEKLEHLLIPSLSAAFLTSNRYHSCKIEGAVEIDLTQYQDETALKACEDTAACDTRLMDALLLEAVATLKQAKKLHDHLETFYVPNMDFGAVAEKREQILRRILDI